MCCAASICIQNSFVPMLHFGCGGGVICFLSRSVTLVFRVVYSEQYHTVQIEGGLWLWSNRKETQWHNCHVNSFKSKTVVYSVIFFMPFNSFITLHCIVGYSIQCNALCCKLDILSNGYCIQQIYIQCTVYTLHTW